MYSAMNGGPELITHCQDRLDYLHSIFIVTPISPKCCPITLIQFIRDVMVIIHISVYKKSRYLLNSFSSFNKVISSLSFVLSTWNNSRECKLSTDSLHTCKVTGP